MTQETVRAAHLGELDTPCLLLDEPRMMANI